MKFVMVGQRLLPHVDRLHLLQPRFRTAIERWCAALESGKYQQGVGSLWSRKDLSHLPGADVKATPAAGFDTDRILWPVVPSSDDVHCCLGVGALLEQGQEGLVDSCVPAEGQQEEGQKVCRRVKLSEEAKDALGLLSTLGAFWYGGRDCSLAALNDSGFWTFKEIAWLIRSVPAGLFNFHVFDVRSVLPDPPIYLEWPSALTGSQPVDQLVDQRVHLPRWSLPRTMETVPNGQPFVLEQVGSKHPNTDLYIKSTEGGDLRVVDLRTNQIWPIRPGSPFGPGAKVYALPWDVAGQILATR